MGGGGGEGEGDIFYFISKETSSPSSLFSIQKHWLVKIMEVSLSMTTQVQDDCSLDWDKGDCHRCQLDHHALRFHDQSVWEGIWHTHPNLLVEGSMGGWRCLLNQAQNSCQVYGFTMAVHFIY